MSYSNWRFWALIVLVVAIYVPLAIAYDKYEKPRIQAIELARQQATNQDIARIAAMDQRDWARELIGKPADKYLPALGLTPYNKIRNFGSVGQHIMVDRSGRIWLFCTYQLGRRITEVDGPYQKPD